MKRLTRQLHHPDPSAVAVEALRALKPCQAVNEANFASIIYIIVYSIYLF